MSVINKMLKDLDDRSPQPVNHTTSVVLPQASKSPIKAILITVFMMLMLTVICFWGWTLYQENQQLKKDIIITSSNNVNDTNANNSILVENAVALPVKQSFNTKTVNESSVLSAQKNKPIPKASSVAKVDSLPKLKPQKLLVEDEAAVLPSSLTISRSAISPEALAKQKMNKAERAIAENNLTLAEQLFEEILLITPKNDAARKQLAALWFGRKSYQPALNLLQQGIVTSPTDEAFRLMKARIHLTVGQVEKAYDVLSPLNNNEDIEYQSLLANAAQQIGNFKAATKAYLTLVNLAPQEGRYWLGLAVAYDSDSQFTQASKAYQSAITQGGLSSGALNFTQQRLAELGEY